MPWMVKWAGPFPPYVESASGAHFRCVDGHDYVDFCLGDTGRDGRPRPGADDRRRRAPDAPRHHPHAPDRGRRLGRRGADPPVRAAGRGSSRCRRPTRTAGSLRLARHITGRSKVVVHDHCYHGSVDEAIADARTRTAPVVPVRGSVGPQVDVAQTTRVVEFNDIDGLEAALADGDVAAVLIEPALTNVGIVLPEPGYHDAVREITRRTGTLLIIDETHTICAGPGRRDRRVGARARHASSSARRSVAGSRRRPTGSAPRSAARIARLDRGRGFRRRRDRRDARRLRPVAGRDAGDARRGPDRRRRSSG